MDESKQTGRPVIYQLIPRIFANKGTKNIKGGTIEENGCGKLNDINPVILNDISDFGATHVWYTGVIEHAQLSDYSNYRIDRDSADIVKGEAGSPYAIKDYYDVDPDLAESIPKRMKEFEALVQRTHEANLKVVIDLVPNHLSRHYVSDSKPEGVKDFGAADDPSLDFSPKNNFYYIPDESFVSPVQTEDGYPWEEFPARVTGNDCFKATPSITDWYETVKLNYGIDFETGEKYFDPIPDTWLKMKDVVLFWASKSVDAFRCDMAEMVPLEFWKWMIAEVRNHYPSIQFIAEIYNPDKYHDYIFKGGFDFLYDKELFYNTMRGVIMQKRPAIEITSCWQGVEGFQHHMLYFLENHDEQRIASDFFARDPLNAIPGLAVMAAMQQNPLLIYFGQELGETGMDEEGFSGVDGRTTIYDYWGLPLVQNWISDVEKSTGQLPEYSLILRGLYSRILNLSKKEPAISKGEFYDLMWSNLRNPAFNCSSLYAFFRYIDNQLLLVVANFSDKDLDYRLQVPSHFFEMAGLNDRLYFEGQDLLKMNKMIQFPAEIALNTGFGGFLRKRSVSIYELKYQQMKRM
ncbi:alpha-amylase family protein [Marinilabilia rubra]|uniref:Alpha-amylase n=1 Tax=Marinilabilia rubra TaxID=2162893 RepID=A0A2U2B3Z5_9BACT|nr:alpha-amylase family protein [Marinilabilia rubra]PWD97779.1 alpha-amylase [Marinilabilia rubra]